MRHRGLVFVPLTRRGGGVQAFKVIYPPAAASATTALQTHEGYEWFYVLDGRVRLVLDDTEHLLDPGEVVEFDTGTPHWIGSADGRPAETLALFSLQSEHAHLSHGAAGPGRH